MSNFEGLKHRYSTIMGHCKNLSTLLAVGAVLLGATSCSDPIVDEPDKPKPEQKIAPTISCDYNGKEVELPQGVEVRIEDNKIFFGDKLILSWKDNYGDNDCKVEIYINGNKFNGRIINEGGECKIIIYDAAGMVSVTFNLNVLNNNSKIRDAWLEIMKNLDLQVDQEEDLLKGVDFDNVEISEAKLNGIQISTDSLHKFKSEYPGTYQLELKVKYKDGKKDTRQCEFKVKPLEYDEIKFDTANYIDEKYSWSRELRQETQDFIQPHLLASYLSGVEGWFQPQLNLQTMMYREGTDEYGVNIIGSEKDEIAKDEHGRLSAKHIRNLMPDGSIKSIAGERKEVKEYAETHPNEFIILYCARPGGRESMEEFENKFKDKETVEDLLNLPNVLIVFAIGDKYEDDKGKMHRLAYEGKTSVYTDPYFGVPTYNLSGINSDNFQVITVRGTKPYRDEYYTPESATNKNGIQSLYGIGYENIIAMPSFVTRVEDSCSSYPTAAFTASMRNILTILSANHPDASLQDLLNIFVGYLVKVPTKYKNKNGEIVTDYNNTECRFDDKSFYDEEVGKKSIIENLNFNSEFVSLPSGYGLCHICKGAQFEYEGERYDVSNKNKGLFMKAMLKNNGKVNQRVNVVKFFKEGGGNDGNIKITTVVLNKNGDALLDPMRERSYPVASLSDIKQFAGLYSDIQDNSMSKWLTLSDVYEITSNSLVGNIGNEQYDYHQDGIEPSNIGKTSVASL